MEIKLRGEKTGIKFFRKFYPCYISEFKNASKIRGILVLEEDYNKICEYINYIKSTNVTDENYINSAKIMC